MIPYLVSTVAWWLGVTDTSAIAQAQAIVLAGVVLAILYAAVLVVLVVGQVVASR